MFYNFIDISRYARAMVWAKNIKDYLFYVYLELYVCDTYSNNRFM